MPGPTFTRRRALELASGATAVAVASGFESGTAAAAGYRSRDYRIESWDGTELAATLFVPDGTGPFPAVLMTHGWGGDRSDVAPRAKRYAGHGFVVLTYDSRGFGESGGQVGVDGPNEVKDAQTLITWLARRDAVQADGDDPVIGMDGESYAGGIQLNTAIADDRLDAIVPRWAWHDLVYSLDPNGVVKSDWDTVLFTYGTTSARGVTDGNNHPDTYDVQGLNPRLDKMIARAATENRLSASDKRWLRERSPVGKLDAVGVPTLLVSGWIDTLFTPHEAVANLHGLRDGGCDARLLLFDGGHTYTLETSGSPHAHTDAAALDWLTTHLKGDGTSDRPVVSFLDDQADTYRHATDIPRPGAGSVTLRCRDVTDGDATLAVNSVAPTSTSAFSPVDADATAVSAPQFEFPLDAAFTAFGAPTARLSVEPLADDVEFFLKVYHVHDGTATLIDSQVTPVRVTGSPGSITETTVAMEPFFRSFDAGDALRFVVSTTDAAYYPDRTSPGAVIHHSSANPSTVTVPSYQRGDVGDPFGSSA